MSRICKRFGYKMGVTFSKSQPEAHIPKCFKEEYFGHIDEHLLKVNATEVLKLENLPFKPTQALIVILFSNPKISPPTCIEFAQNMLRLDDNTIISISAAMGQLEILKMYRDKAYEIYGSDTLKGLLKTKVFEDLANDIVPKNTSISPDGLRYFLITIIGAFKNACKGGQVGVLNWLKAEVPDLVDFLIEHLDFSSFTLAVQYENINVLEWFKEQNLAKLPDMIRVDHYYCFRSSFESENTEVTNWILDNSSSTEKVAMIKTLIYENNKYFHPGTHEIIRKACTKCCIPILECYFNINSNLLRNLIKSYDFSAVREAINTQDPGLINWFKDKKIQLPTESDISARKSIIGTQNFFVGVSVTAENSNNSNSMNIV